MRRPLTHAEVLDSWRIDAELSGGHTVQQMIGFVGELMDIADEQAQQQALPPAGVISPDIDPRERVLAFLRRIFGRG